MTDAAARPFDQQVDVADGGGQVRTLALVDEQSTDDLELIEIDGRLVHPHEQFDLVFSPYISQGEPR